MANRSSKFVRTMKVVSVKIMPKGSYTTNLPLFAAVSPNNQGQISKVKDLKRWLAEAFGSKAITMDVRTGYQSFSPTDEYPLYQNDYRVYCDGFTTLQFQVLGSTSGTRFEKEFSQSFPSEFTWREVKEFLARFVLYTKASVDLFDRQDDARIRGTKEVVYVQVNDRHGAWVKVTPWDNYETLAICCDEGTTVGDAMRLIGDGIGHPWYLVKISSGWYQPDVCFLESECLVTAAKRGELRFKAVLNEIWFVCGSWYGGSRGWVVNTDSKPTLEALESNLRNTFLIESNVRLYFNGIIVQRWMNLALYETKEWCPFTVSSMKLYQFDYRAEKPFEDWFASEDPVDYVIQELNNHLRTELGTDVKIKNLSEQSWSGKLTSIWGSCKIGDRKTIYVSFHDIEVTCVSMSRGTPFVLPVSYNTDVLKLKDIVQEKMHVPAGKGNILVCVSDRVLYDDEPISTIVKGYGLLYLIQEADTIDVRVTMPNGERKSWSGSPATPLRDICTKLSGEEKQKLCFVAGGKLLDPKSLVITHWHQFGQKKPLELNAEPIQTLVSIDIEGKRFGVYVDRDKTVEDFQSWLQGWTRQGETSSPISVQGSLEIYTDSEFSEKVHGRLVLNDWKGDRPFYLKCDGNVSLNLTFIKYGTTEKVGPHQFPLDCKESDVRSWLSSDKKGKYSLIAEKRALSLKEEDPYIRDVWVLGKEIEFIYQPAMTRIETTSVPANRRPASNQPCKSTAVVQNRPRKINLEINFVLQKDVWEEVPNDGFEVTATVNDAIDCARKYVKKGKPELEEKRLGAFSDEFGKCPLDGTTKLEHLGDPNSGVKKKLFVGEILLVKIDPAGSGAQARQLTLLASAELSDVKSQRMCYCRADARVVTDNPPLKDLAADDNTVRLIEIPEDDVCTVTVVMNGQGKDEDFRVAGCLPVSVFVPFLQAKLAQESQAQASFEDIWDADDQSCYTKNLKGVKGVLKLVYGSESQPTSDVPGSSGIERMTVSLAAAEEPDKEEEHGPGKEYKFIIESEEHQLFILDTDKVSNVRKKIANLKETDPQLVGVFFAGRKLDDNTVISKLPIRPGIPIIAFVMDVSEILIRTAKALRLEE